VGNYDRVLVFSYRFVEPGSVQARTSVAREMAVKTEATGMPDLNCDFFEYWDILIPRRHQLDVSRYRIMWHGSGPPVEWMFQDNPHIYQVKSPFFGNTDSLGVVGLCLKVQAPESALLSQNSNRFQSVDVETGRDHTPNLQSKELSIPGERLQQITHWMAPDRAAYE
jgi:hypothetical protein